MCPPTIAAGGTLPCHYVASPFQQQAQDAKGLLLQLDLESILAQLPGLEIFFEQSEADESHRRWRGTCLIHVATQTLPNGLSLSLRQRRSKLTALENPLRGGGEVFEKPSPKGRGRDESGPERQWVPIDNPHPVVSYAENPLKSPLVQGGRCFHEPLAPQRGMKNSSEFRSFREPPPSLASLESMGLLVTWVSSNDCLQITSRALKFLS